MNDIARNLFHRHIEVTTLLLLTLSHTSVQAAPSIVDSLVAAQLPGIELNHVSSIYAENGTLWITDESNQVYQWKRGEKPSVFQKGSENQSFSSTIRLKKNSFALTDPRNDQFMVSHHGSWNFYSGSGDVEGEINNPIAAAWFNDQILYIADADNDRISAFNNQGIFLFSFGNTAPKENQERNLNNILGISLDRTGRVYVLDDSNGSRISIYSPMGTLDTIIGKDEFTQLLKDKVRISAMTVRPDGIIIIADKSSGRIIEFDWASMELLSTFGTNGKGRGQFLRISCLTLDNDGKLYVADQGNEKIEIFQMDWHPTPWINLEQERPGVHPSSVLMSACESSYIYGDTQILCLNTSNNHASLRNHDGSIVTDLSAKFDDPLRAVFDNQETFILDDNGVKVFDNKGKFKFEFGSPGRQEGSISYATGIALTQNSVYIADTGNKRVQEFSRKGLYQRSIGNEKGAEVKLNEPTSVAVDMAGNIYVADNTLHQVLVYSNSGKLTKQLGFPAEHPHEFSTIHDVMTSDSNMLYVMASTPANPMSVWLYENSEFRFRFSPTKAAPKGGIDQQWAPHPKPSSNQNVEQLIKNAENNLVNVKEMTIDLTSEPVAALFQGSSGIFGSSKNWMFNPILGKNDTLTMLDVNNHARHTFTMLFPPKQVRNISINGDEKTMRIKWLAESSDFSGYYTIYGRKDPSSPFLIVQQTTETEVLLPRDTLEAMEFRISASSPLTKESELSAVYQDEFWQGLQAYEKNNLELALTKLQNATISNVEHAAAWLYLGKTHMALGSYDKAIAIFANLGRFEERKQQSIHLQAEALMLQKSWLEVKALIDTAEKEGNADARLYSIAAKALIHINDIPSAIYYLNQAVSKEPTVPAWHTALADANYKLGAKDAAITELKTAASLAGEDSNAWVDIARTYEKHQLAKEAINSYNNALKVSPAHENALPELASLYLKENMLTEAKGLATKMAGILELNATSYYILGRAALHENNTPQALSLLAKAGQINPNHAEVWLYMSNAYAQLKNPEREKEFLIKAAALDDTNFEVHNRLANLCSSQKDFECAAEQFEIALNIDSKRAETHIAYAKALMAMGRMSDANVHAHEAINIQANSIPALLTLAEVESSRGMVSNSIATLKRGMTLDSANMEIHLALSKAYIANQMYTEATAITEKAILLDVRNPEPLILLGNIYLARQSFDEAVASFEKAVALDPGNAKYQLQLNIAYLQKKRMVDAGGNMLGLKLNDIEFSHVFSAAYKQYTDEPVAKLTINNEAGVDYTNVKVSFFVKEYMDFPTSTVVERIPANGKAEVSLLAAFNNKILSIDESTGVQTEVRAEFYMAGKPHTETHNESMTIYGKNSIIWDHLDMVGSFSTPKDETLAVFIRQLTNIYSHKGGAVNPNIAKAMTVYNGLSSYGIKYLADPNTPYGNLGDTQLDTIQFPRETLRQRSGDCDDLSILLSASLANLGMETAVLDVPAHLLMMFNTGVPAFRKDTISLHDNALVIYEDEVWIPLEATLINSSFTEAWAEGARKYHLYNNQGKLKVMPMATAWKTYPPVTLPPASFTLNIPDQSASEKINKEWGILSVKALERQVNPYRIMLAMDSTNAQAQMQIAVIYARNGLYHQALKELEAIRTSHPEDVAVLNNLGNIYYLQENYPLAISMYEKAAVAAPDKADIKVNLAMAKYKSGDALAATKLFSEASAIDDQIPSRYSQFAFLLQQ